jgi:hypothetical protein
LSTVAATSITPGWIRPGSRASLSLDQPNHSSSSSLRSAARPMRGSIRSPPLPRLRVVVGVRHDLMRAADKPSSEVTGSNPVRPTRHFLFLDLPGSALWPYNWPYSEGERMPPGHRTAGYVWSPPRVRVLPLLQSWSAGNCREMLITARDLVCSFRFAGYGLRGADCTAQITRLRRLRPEPVR